MCSQPWQSKFDFKNDAVNPSVNQKDDTQWMNILSTKENILNGYSPYMPILIEKISNYVQLADFEFERVKEVQTVGIVYGREWETTSIYNWNQDNITSIQLSFKCCRKRILCQSGYNPGSKYPCKLFGRLINLHGKPLLEVHYLLKTDDLEGTLKTTTMLSHIVREKYHYYNCV